MKRKDMGVYKMRKEYDFSDAKPNPYLKRLRKQISLRIDVDTIDFFKRQTEETGIAYQNLINEAVPKPQVLEQQPLKSAVS